MNVLSLFDGMSCGRIALERAGIKVDNYYASEVDSHAIKVTQANWPETVQLGDVQHINYQMLPKIDLIIGGSPCQGFSFAGKQLNFSDPRSALFFEFVHAIRTLKPKYFMLENVKMRKDILSAISGELGVEPVFINSALVSGASRQRYYWTNIPGVTQPEDRGIKLSDILESGTTDREKAHCIDANYWKGATPKNYFTKSRRQMVYRGDIKEFPHWETLEKSQMRMLTPLEIERLQTVPEGYTDHVSNTQRCKMLGNGWTVDVIAHIFRGLL